MQNILMELANENKEFQDNVVVERQKYPGNTILIAENEFNQSIYVVVSGGVKVTTRAQMSTMPTGKPELADLLVGDTFGEFCLFDSSPTSATVYTTTESEIIELSRAGLLEFMQNHPEHGYKILFELMEKMVVHLRDSNRSILQLLQQTP